MSPARLLFAVARLTLILGGVHAYLWARLVRDTALPPPWGGVAAGALALFAASTLGGLAITRIGQRQLARPVAWLVFTWLGVMFYLFVLLVASDVALGVASLARRAIGAGAVDPAGHASLARAAAGIVSALALALVALGMRNALGETAVVRVQVPLAKLAAGTPPYRIVQVSDIHVGPTIGEAFVRDLVERVNALEPDCVVITGDLVDGRVAEIGALAAPLGGLRAKDGVYFVTGNHEYHAGVDAWLAFLGDLGVRVLRNERVAIGPIDLAGVDDWSAKRFGRGHGADLPRALAGRDPARAVVLLAHQPQAIVEAERLGVDLQLSGHTHGGQVFPWSYAVRLVTPYVAGLYRHKSASPYVSRGTGYWGPPLRVGAPAEITHLELISG